jgi:hypothetical protein
MNAFVTISTDSLIISEAKAVEARTTMEALLAALHHETSAHAHLRDLPLARLHIEVWPAEAVPFGVATLNEEAGNA